MAQRRSATSKTKLEKPTLWADDASDQPQPFAVHRTGNAQDYLASPDELIIDHLVLHSLDSENGRLTLIDDDAQLDDATHAYFVQHIHYADSEAEWHAEFEDPSHHIMNTCVSLLRRESASFAQTTHDLANRLYEIMSGRGHFRDRIAPGDLIVVLYHTISNPMHRLAILKVELDVERRTRDFIEINGHREVIFKQANGLLPQVEKLQKCAIIWLEADDKIPSLRLLDKDAGPASDGIAAFFYKDFLGATLGMSPKRRTRLFWAETNKWLNARASAYEPLELLQFFHVRRTALGGERLDVQRFVTEALPNHAHDAQSLLDTLVEKLGLEDEEGALAFEVNSQAAKSYVDNVTLLLDGKMKLRVSADTFHDLVHVSESRTGERKITITLETLTFQEVSG